ncbi:MAG: atpF [Candidatus Saccharibacteria bacterium]|nr:atpF [Candidatus Saccharibacteria bacterium]
MQPLTQFATTTNGNVFTSLGIDWQMLILQIVAFLILVFILGKYVYPWLIKSVDERQANIEAANKAASEAQSAAVDAEARVEKLLKIARDEAADIVATAKLESAAALSASEEKAKKRSEQIVADAQGEIQKEVVAAKKALHNETLELVALATEKVVGKAVSSKIDESLITDSLKAVK